MLGLDFSVLVEVKMLLNETEVLLSWLPKIGHCGNKQVCPRLRVTTQKRRVIDLRNVEEMKLELSEINEK